MIDVHTKKPLEVEYPPKPFFYVSADLVDSVRPILDRHKFRYYVSENQFSWNNQPYVTIIFLERGTDANAVQAALDSVP